MRYIDRKFTNYGEPEGVNTPFDEVMVYQPKLTPDVKKRNNDIYKYTALGLAGAAGIGYLANKYRIKKNFKPIAESSPPPVKDFSKVRNEHQQEMMKSPGYLHNIDDLNNYMKK